MFQFGRLLSQGHFFGSIGSDRLGLLAHHDVQLMPQDDHFQVLIVFRCVFLIDVDRSGHSTLGGSSSSKTVPMSEYRPAMRGADEFYWARGLAGQSIIVAPVYGLVKVFTSNLR